MLETPDEYAYEHMDIAGKYSEFEKECKHMLWIMKNNLHKGNLEPIYDQVHSFKTYFHKEKGVITELIKYEESIGVSQKGWGFTKIANAQKIAFKQDLRSIVGTYENLTHFGWNIGPTGSKILKEIETKHGDVWKVDKPIIIKKEDST